jgi:hypothetical protein
LPSQKWITRDRTDGRLQVSDAYKKVGLAPGYHRVNMCSEAVEPSSWLMVDPFETVNCNDRGEPQYVPTAQVLRHFDHEINTVLGGIEGTDGQMKKARVALLAGMGTVAVLACRNANIAIHRRRLGHVHG